MLRSWNRKGGISGLIHVFFMQDGAAFSIGGTFPGKQKFNFPLQARSMKTILFMRHAKSDWEQTGVSDHDRPLNARGKRIAPAIGLYLFQHALVPEMVIVSTARRAQETLELMLPNWPTRPDVVSQRGLYMATGRAFFQAIADVPDQMMRVLVIGHNPGMTALAGMFDRTSPHFPTAAVLHLRSSKTEWAEIVESPANCEFVGLLRPKELGLDTSAEDD